MLRTARPYAVPRRLSDRSVRSHDPRPIAVSGNDNKVFNVNGVVTVLPNPSSDTVAVIDLKSRRPV